MRDGKTLIIEASAVMQAGTERRRSDDPVLLALQAIRQDIATLNTRLFGNPEGDPGDEGRLVVAERRINNHAERIQRMERLVAAGAVIVAVVKVAFEHWK